MTLFWWEKPSPKKCLYNTPFLFMRNFADLSWIWFDGFIGFWKQGSRSLCSLIPIRQDYNFDMLAIIWHEIFVDFWKCTKIWKGLQHRNKELFLFWHLDVQSNFTFTQKQSKTGKNPEISRQSFVIWWHNSRKYRSVWCLLSCT